MHASFQRGLFCLPVVLTCLIVSPGCHLTRHHQVAVPDVSRETSTSVLPEYILESPDIILIDAIRLVPKPPYRIEPLDGLVINLANPLTEPVSGVYPVDPDGTVNLGATYGSVQVSGLTLPEATKAITDQIKKVVKEPVVQVGLAQSRALQQIKGEHLIRPDGTVGLGSYGDVHVTGMTLKEAKAAIEAHLSMRLLKPEVSVDVFAYNSKVYYIITDGGGYGEQVYRFAVTGNETVLDAMSQINGLPPVSSRKRIWVARPSGKDEADEILPVNWKAITRHGKTTTNYQILPGDRIYVQADPLITADSFLAKLISPVERVFGVALLGNAVAEGIFMPSNINGNGGGGFR